ncbi:hypothetical protein Csa_011211 [Cucumis sativus]|uniref:Uncharacterized protein n=1 Tax=Cucumis sativus TaxID=3659 RepID=A0A0A0LB26_CUCSA|nr:hypothetical protein Csa_011211 [Cucumis sativus]
MRVSLYCQCRDVKIEYKQLKEKVREYTKRDAQFYSNILAKMNKLKHVESGKSGGKQGAEPMIIDSKT